MKPALLLPVFVLMCVGAAVPAQAQNVVNPTTVEFDPSADHYAVTASNQPVVQRYELQISMTSGTFTAVANLGKPAPQADGKIRVVFSTLITPRPLPNGTYQARVVAIGPTGTASSDASNSFSFQTAQSCTITLGSVSQAVPAGGSSGTVTVNATSGCSWTATSGASWVVLNATGGTGSGTVGFTVTANTQAAARAATIAIGVNNTFTVTQAAAGALSKPTGVRAVIIR